MSLFSSLWTAVTSIFSMVKRKPSWTEAVPMVMAQILPLVNQAIEYGGATDKEKFDDWLKGLDAATGSDPGAAIIISDIPRDKAEIFWDHVIEAARIFGYAKLNVKGYETPK